MIKKIIARILVIAVLVSAIPIGAAFAESDSVVPFDSTISKSDVKQTEVTLSWVTPDTVDAPDQSYQVYMSLTDNIDTIDNITNNGDEVGSVLYEPTYTVEGLSPGTTYYFNIIANIEGSVFRYTSTSVTTAASSTPVEENYLNPLNSTDGLENINTTGSGGDSNGVISAVTGGVQLSYSGGTGNHFIVDNNSPSAVNGTVSVNMTPDSHCRSGVMFRVVNNQNYTWVGLTEENKFIIREAVAGIRRDVQNVSNTGGKTGILKVVYNGDNLKVYMNNNLLYDGLRPHKRADAILVDQGGPSYTDALPPVAGKEGFMGWSLMNSVFADLNYEVPPKIDERYITLINNMENNLDVAMFTAESWTSFESAVTAASLVFESGASGAEASYNNVVQARNALRYNGTQSAHINEFTDSIGNLVWQKGLDLSTISLVNGSISHNTEGELLFIDNSSPMQLNGVASMDVSFPDMENSRTALVFRAKDLNNLSFVGVESTTNIRIREMTDGNLTDLEISGLSLPSSFKLKVEYVEDKLTVYADNTVLYDGLRPIAAQSGGNPVLPPIWGQVGVYLWYLHNVTIDNLTSDSFAVIKEASFDGQFAAASIDKASKTVTLYAKGNTALNSITPLISVVPSSASVLPQGSQDFSDGKTVAYTLTSNDGLSSQWTVKVTRVDDALETISSGVLDVLVNKQYPQVYSYTLKGANPQTIDGSLNYSSDKITINDTEYDPQVSMEKADASTARYQVTVPGVDPDGNGAAAAREVKFTYEITVNENTVIKKMTGLTGDEPGIKFIIKLAGAVLSVASDKEGAQLATNGGTENTVYAVSSAQAFDISNLSFTFISHSGASGTIYTKYQYNTPYRAVIEGSGSNKKASIYETGYNRRLQDGTVPVTETSNGVTEEVGYESYVYICGDANGNGTVDWQDSALWVREQIPQVPDDLAEFFEGGNWTQTHGAFPGNGSINASTYNASSSLYSTPEQLVEIQRQFKNMTDGMGRMGFCYVGWNGRGHDYGWPNINEVTFNPILGTVDEFKAEQVKMKEAGGSLGFHLNMTDMTTNSESYLRNQTVSDYGNRSSSTGTSQYTNTFGWSAYKINHFTDYPYALKRQDAFAERFNIPFILYQDVMLPYTMGNYGLVEEQYAMRREIEHWKVLGAYAATEYYYPEKRTGGQFMMKNYKYPNIVDEFIIAGQTMFHNTRDYQTLPSDYIWANLYSDNARTGNIMNTNILEAAEQETEFSFLLSYTNSYVAKNKLAEYGVNGNTQYTLWGNGIRYEADNTTKALKITKNGNDIARMSVEGGRLTGDSFVPAADGTGRIFTFSSGGGEKTWVLPDEITANSFKLYRLTGEGRVFVGNVAADNRNVTLNLEAKSGYVLYYSDNIPQNIQVNENYNQNVPVSASSRIDMVLFDDFVNNIPREAAEDYVPVSKATDGNWDNDLHNLTSSMKNANGDLRFYKFVSAGFAADNLSSTYWQPVDTDYSDGNVWVKYTYYAPRTVKNIKASFIADSDVEYDVKVAGRDAGNNEVAIYEGKMGKDFSLDLAEPKTVKDITLTIYTSDPVKLAEFGAYSLLDKPDTTAPSLTDGSAVRTSDTEATIKFTSDEDGQYYYAVVEDGAGEPEIVTSGAGIAYTAGETTITNPTGLSAGAKDIYIKVKDASGNVSDALKIGIPAYQASVQDILVLDTNSTISAGNLTKTGLTLIWELFEPEDVNEIGYQVYMSFSDNIDTIANIIANGEPVVGASGENIATSVITGLTPNTIYYFNIIATDYKNDNTQYRYTKVSVKTLDESDTTAPSLTDGSAVRTSDTEATVKFTSDEDGQYYYAVAEDGAGEPEIVTSGAGIAYTAGETTITNPTGLSAGAKDIYIKVKDAAGNVSSALKIDIAGLAAPDTTSPILTAGAVNRISDTEATVKFSSDEAGVYYYAVVAAGTAEPEIVTSGAGAACGMGETTITNPAGLSAGAMDIYIKEKDAAGNVSSALKTNIADCTLKQFTIVSAGKLDRTAGIQASADVEPIHGMDTHAGKEVVVFQLMKGSLPVSIVAVEKDISSAETFTAYYNVADPQNTAYLVRVYVFDRFDSDTAVPINLAEAAVLD